VQLLTKNEIAVAHRVTPRTIDNWVARGLLSRPKKLGQTDQARVRWTEDQVAELDRRLGLTGAGTSPAAAGAAA
jgi:hypothetical protein